VQQDEDFAELVQEFLAGLPAQLGKLEAALNEQDFQALRTCAHQLKGSGGGYGYPALTTHAADLERSAADAQLQACQEGVAELKSLIPRLVLRAD
jgi:HPt (histidine-containing phosphotransfer) domain-containing protein